MNDPIVNSEQLLSTLRSRIVNRKPVKWGQTLVITELRVNDVMVGNFVKALKTNRPNITEPELEKEKNNILIKDNLFNLAMDKVAEAYEIEVDPEDLREREEEIRSGVKDMTEEQIKGTARISILKQLIFEDLAKQWEIVVDEEFAKKMLNNFYKQTGRSVRDILEDPVKLAGIRDNIKDEIITERIVNAFGSRIELKAKGAKEALELRDGDLSRFMGKGVKKAVHYINYVLGPSLIENNVNPADQSELDQFLIDLDGTENKSRYGANAILAVSLSIAKAIAKSKGIPFYQYVAELSGSFKVNRFVLPLPLVNVINGGAHSDNTLDFQEFMFVPVGASSMHEAIRISAECFHSLAKYLSSKGLSTAKGDEGGFAPNFSSTEEALNAMIIAVEQAGYRAGVIHGHVAIALDCAASELYDSEAKKYKFKKMISAGLLKSSLGTKTTTQMIDYYVELVEKYPIISIEDPLSEEDHDG
ncbi:hypothetical protein PVNG_02416 [Plasmodium vivax North Korean]|uniref:Enolase n=1 Tax=Plasmodium vivax North Korean TaxID=1035514 RepID=A0A0J9W6R3_PLAVI|nr:hypothetical protein PVNG_02416 [Plasmodium vivax North Korean]